VGGGEGTWLRVVGTVVSSSGVVECLSTRSFDLMGSVPDIVAITGV